MLLPVIAQAQEKDSEWQLERGRVIGGSSMESGARLMDPVVMDLDGDGIDDVIFGAPGTNPNGVTSAGSVYVIRGKKDWDLSGKIDVTYWNSFDYRFDGHTQGGMLGMNLMTGDFNGDGLRDLAIAEPGGYGVVYVLYGGKKRENGVYDIAQNGGADVSFVSSTVGSNLGISGCVGDFNRDGTDDLALAHIAQNTQLGNNTSLVTVLTMRREWDKKSYDIGSKIYGKTVLSRPVSNNTRVVHSCAAGDFNDDGLTDIALGMPLDTYQKQKAAGSVTIIYHPHKYNGTTIDLSKVDEKYGLRINGNQAGAQFGYSIAAGDFTGDGRDDLVVSAPNRLVVGPHSEGAVFLFDANNFPKETGEQSESLKLVGQGGNFGYRIQAVDVNGDKRPDLVVQAPTSEALQNGAISVWLGGPHFLDDIASNPKPDIVLKGAEFMGFGYGAAFGDVNQDAKIDAVVRTASDPMQRNMTGAQTIIGNFQELPQSSNLTDNFLTVLAPSNGGGLSEKMRIVEYGDKKYRAWLSPNGLGNRSVICLKSVDSPLSDDLALSAQNQCDIQIVGPENAPFADFDINPSPTLKPQLTVAIPSFELKNSIGVVAIIPLPEQISQPLVLKLNENTLKTEAQTYILSGEDASELGATIEWFDIDQDGFEDLIIGAPKRRIDQETSGSVFIAKGSASPKNGFHELTGNDVIQFEGFANEELGRQWKILDFNHDGLLDLLIQAAHTPDASGEDFATVYVVYGVGKKQPKSYNIKSPDMATLRIIAAQNRADLEIVPGNVDLNRDGFDDVMLISRNYRAGLQKQGIFYVILSNENYKTGELHLTEESHIAFSFTPARNEKLVDARFIVADEKLRFLTDSADMATGQTSTLDLFSEKDDEPYQGQYTASRLVRVRSEARLPKSVQIIQIPDSDRKNDEIWLLFPHDGIVQSGQGIAQKLR